MYRGSVLTNDDDKDWRNQPKNGRRFKLWWTVVLELRWFDFRM